jgi:hypothetical protein
MIVGIGPIPSVAPAPLAVAPGAVSGTQRDSEAADVDEPVVLGDVPLLPSVPADPGAIGVPPGLTVGPWILAPDGPGAIGMPPGPGEPGLIGGMVLVDGAPVVAPVEPPGAMLGAAPVVGAAPVAAPGAAPGDAPVVPPVDCAIAIGEVAASKPAARATARKALPISAIPISAIMLASIGGAETDRMWM